MPVYQELVSFDKEFSRLKEVPVIVNDLVNSSDSDREYIREMVTSRYSGDMITLLPTCRCGETKGEFSIGVKCPECGTLVMSSLEDEIDSILWFRRPEGVQKLILPHVWIMLKNRFKKSGFNVIQWLVDTNYKSTGGIKVPKVVEKLVQMNVPRGYNYFVEHFDDMMDLLFNMKDFELTPKGKRDYLRELLLRDRDKIFSDYIPLPNKSILIIEKTTVGQYIDPIIVDAVDAIEMLTSIDVNFYDLKPKAKENRTVKGLSKISDFYERFYKSNLSPKENHFRRHICGTRTNFSFRAVISSITGTHRYNEIEVPWGVGLTAFRYHLISKLMKLGMDRNSALGMLLTHTCKYHPTLDRLLGELISESPDKGIYCILQRN